MPDWQVVAIAILAGAVALGSPLLVWAILAQRERQRSARLEPSALQIGFLFDREGTTLAGEFRPPLSLLQRGRSNHIRNLMRGGSAAGETLLYDHHFTEGAGRSTRTYKQTVAEFHLGDVVLPQFSLGSERWYHKLVAQLGLEDIDFASNPEFSRRYLLQGADEAAVRALFHPALLAFLERLDGKRPWCIEGNQHVLIIYRLGKRAAPPELAEFLNATFAIALEFRRSAAGRRPFAAAA